MKILYTDYSDITKHVVLQDVMEHAVNKFIKKTLHTNYTLTHTHTHSTHTLHTHSTHTLHTHSTHTHTLHTHTLHTHSTHTHSTHTHTLYTHTHTQELSEKLLTVPILVPIKRCHLQFLFSNYGPSLNELYW